MNKEAIMYGVIGLLVGGIIAGLTAGYSVNHGYSSMMRVMGVNGNKVTSINMPMHGTSSSTDKSMGMDSMVTGLQGKTGDEFDKAFIAEMIIHHQGAIDMAKLAQQNAKHQEVKTLATNIIAAQTSEIDAMKSWQTQWNYPRSSTNESGDMMNMMH